MTPRTLPLVIAALVGCNAPPQDVQVTLSPANPTTVDDLVAQVDASDPDGDELTIRYTWYQDSARIPSLGSNTVPSTDTAKGQTWTLEVEVADTEGNTSTGEASVTIANIPPTASVQLAPDDVTCVDELVATPTGADADDDDVDFSYTWTRDGSLQAAYTEATLPAGVGQRGQTWRVTATPHDGEEAGSPATSERSFNNAPPAVSAVAISPAQVNVLADPMAMVTGSDCDDDDVTYNIVWRVNGEPNGAGPTLIRTTFQRGDVLSLTVTPNDGRVNGEPFVVDDIAVGNAPPLVTDVSLTSATPYTDAALVCAAGTASDPDGDPITLAYQWFRNGSPIAGATGSELAPGLTTRGNTYACAVQASDGIAQSGAVTSNDVSIVNAPPVLASLQIANPSPGTGEAMRLTLGAITDVDGDTVTLSYEWFVNGSSVGNLPELPATEFEREDVVYARVIPNDGFVDGAPVTTSQVVIGNALPVVTAIVLTPANARAQDDITATVTASDPNGDPVTLTYAWSIDNTPVPGVTGTVLTGDRFRRDQQIRVTVTPSDTEDTGLPVTSAPLTILNSVPQISGAEIVPATPTEQTLVRCNPLGWFDADDDPEGVVRTWFVNGSTVTPPEDYLTGDDYNRGDVITCTLVPDDTVDLGTPQGGGPAIVGNEAPYVGEVVLSPAAPTEGGTITATPVDLGDLDPADVPNLTMSYVWYANNVVIPGQTGSTLTSAWFDRGQSIKAVGVPTDGTDFGSPVTSNTVVIANSPPTISSVTLAPASPGTATPLTATSVVVDNDPNDHLVTTLTHVWEVATGTNWAVISNNAGATLPSAYFSRGQRVRVTVTANDGQATSPPLRSSEVTVVNTLPAAPGVRVTPRWSSPGSQPLRCEITLPAADPDNDAVTYVMSWTVNGVPYGGATQTTWPGDTVAAAALGDNQTWTCTARPADPTGQGTAATASAFTVDLDLTGVAGGLDYTCATGRDGKARCWGYNDFGQARAPNAAITDIDAGNTATCGLNASSMPQCWGANLASPPAVALRDVQVGVSNACGLTTIGTVLCWGTNSFNESLPPNGTWRVFATGSYHSCALDASGTTFCWGRNNEGQRTPPPGVVFTDLVAGGEFTCGLTREGTIQCWGASALTSPPTGTFVALAAGFVHACAIDSDDQITCWGDETLVDLTPPPGDYAIVSPGARHTCATTTAGEIVCWGASNRSQLQPSGLVLDAVAPGVAHTCGILSSTGEATCWGLNDDGQTQVPTSLGPVIEVAAARSHSCAIDETGALDCWGNGQALRLAHPTSGSWFGLDAGLDHTCAINTSGALSCWGSGSLFAVSDTPTTGVWEEVVAGEAHSCARDNVNGITCWGDNSSGQRIPPAGTFRTLAAGTFHNCAIKSDRSIACWGSNASNQSTPPIGTNWDKITAGNAHTCAITTLGAITCWGSGANARTTPPTGVFTDIEAGRDHTCAIRSDGRTICWGLYTY